MRHLFSALFVVISALYALSTMAADKVIVIPLGGANSYLYWQGEWSTTTTYKIGDGVHHNGSSYICILQHDSSSLIEPSNDQYWSPLALAGSTGPQGPPGIPLSTLTLGEALLYDPLSLVPENLMQISSKGLQLAYTLYTVGYITAEEYCQWALRHLNSTYLNAADDTARLTALQDHAAVMQTFFQTAHNRFDVGEATMLDVHLAEYYAESATLLVDGFTNKISP